MSGKIHASIPAASHLAAALLVAGMAAALSACVAPDAGSARVERSSQASSSPRYASYRCDGDTEITVENFRSSVHVVDSRGVDVELPASPPAQTARYGQPGYALILEGRNALWMVSRKRPVNCTR